MLRCVKAPAARVMLAALLVAVSFPSARAGDRTERGHRAIRVPGLAPDYPDVHCNQSEVCVVTTQRARDWTRILTDGKGIFCTAQQEDNAIYAALKRGVSAKLLDLDRVAVLRAGSDFLVPYEGHVAARRPCPVTSHQPGS